MKKTLILILIIFLASIMRLYRLSDYPVGIHIDEASFAYNAYSILKTGNDEFGHRLPFFFESEGDYKLPVQSYLSVIPVALFGLNIFSARIITAFFSILLIPLIYMLSLKILKKEKISFLACFIFSVIPWSFLFARQGTEVVTSTLFLCGSLICYLKFKEKQSTIYLLSFVSLSIIAMLTYRTATIFVLVFYFALLIIEKGNIKNNKTFFQKSLVAYLIFFLSFLIISGSIFKRTNNINLTNSGEIKNFIELNLREDGVFPRSLSNLYIVRAFHNKALSLALFAQKNFWSQLDFSYLFFDGGTMNNMIPDIGNLYIFEAFFVLIYIIWLKKMSEKNTNIIIPGVWILATILPSSFAIDAVNASRTFSATVGFAMAIACGYAIFLSTIKSNKTKTLSKLLIVTLYLFFFSFMIHQFFIHKPARTAWYRDAGLKEAVTYIETNKNKYEKVIYGKNILTLYAFWNHLDPFGLQEKFENSPEAGTKRNMKNIDDKFETNLQNCNFHQGLKNVLYVCFGSKIPKESKIIKVFRYSDSRPNVILIEYDDKADLSENAALKLPKFVLFY